MYLFPLFCFHDKWFIVNKNTQSGDRKQKSIAYLNPYTFQVFLKVAFGVGT